MTIDYGTPIPPIEEQPQKKSNTWLIVIIVILVVFCCCCVGGAATIAFLWNYGDKLFGTGGMLLPYLLV